MNLTTVKVPLRDKEIFSSAEKYVADYFASMDWNPEKGTITIGGERYVFVRADSLSCNFLQFMVEMYPSIEKNESIAAANKVLYDMGHSFGLSDARAFHTKTGATDPKEKLATGPIHFAYSGWASVEIHDAASQSPDEEYYSIYDHPQSFEADSWIKSKKNPTHCVCVLSSGYAAGWNQESYGVPLSSREILCRAKGDPFCRFILCQPHRVEEFVLKYQLDHPHLFQPQDSHE